MGDDDISREELQYSIDTFWILWGSCQVFFMQVGFSMLEVGSVQQNCTINVLMKNIVDVTISVICWGLFGYAIAFGDSADEYGIVPSFEHFFIKKGHYGQWLFQWAFVSTAATIVSGAVAERIQFKAYVYYAFLLSLITYPILVHWTWSDQGVLSRTKDEAMFGCGVLDFAGSGVVHYMGGLSSLIAVALMGPRTTVSYDKGVKMAPLGQSDVFKTLGTLSLWFGWFGFNGASSVLLVGHADTAARTMVMTTISGGTSGITSGALWMYINNEHQININPALNGILAGLVGITANCATVETEAAFLIGIGSAFFYTLGLYFLDKFEIDDVVQAVPVHLFSGIWGMIAAGFFTSPTLYKDAFETKHTYECAGLFYGGSGRQLGANLVFLVLSTVWVCSTVGLLFFYLHKRGSLRVALFDEKIGVDTVMHNENIELANCEMDHTKGRWDVELEKNALNHSSRPVTDSLGFHVDDSVNNLPLVQVASGATQVTPEKGESL